MRKCLIMSQWGLQLFCLKRNGKERELKMGNICMSLQIPGNVFEYLVLTVLTPTTRLPSCFLGTRSDAEWLNWTNSTLCLKATEMLPLTFTIRKHIIKRVWVLRQKDGEHPNLTVVTCQSKGSHALKHTPLYYYYHNYIYFIIIFQTKWDLN